jgi:hypothetical protein
MNININNFEVLINDKIISKDKYNIKDSIITFKETPEVGDKIIVREIKQDVQNTN